MIHEAAAKQRDKPIQTSTKVSIICGQKQHAKNNKDFEDLTTYQNHGLACDCKSHNAIRPATLAQIVTICIHNWLYKKLKKQFYRTLIINFSSMCIMGASFCSLDLKQSIQREHLEDTMNMHISLK
jgi:hypothetical protein